MIIQENLLSLYNDCMLSFAKLNISVYDIQSMFNELDKFGYYAIVHPMLDFSNSYSNWSFEVTNNTGLSISDGFGYSSRNQASLEAIKQALKIYDTNKE